MDGRGRGQAALGR